MMATGPMKWGPRFSFVGMLGGVIGGLGLLVLLQQTGRVYPTFTVTIAFLVGGLLVGVAMPSLGVLIAVRRTNRRLTASATTRTSPAATQPRAGGAAGGTAGAA